MSTSTPAEKPLVDPERDESQLAAMILASRERIYRELAAEEALAKANAASHPAPAARRAA